MPAKKPPDKKRNPVFVFLKPAEIVLFNELAEKAIVERDFFSRDLIYEALEHRGLEPPA
jgi:hypothetical protein